MASFSCCLSTAMLPPNATKALSYLKKLHSNAQAALDGAQSRNVALGTEAPYLKDLEEILYDAEDVILDSDFKLLKEKIEGKPGAVTCGRWQKGKRSHEEVRDPENTCGIPCWKCIESKSEEIRAMFSAALKFKKIFEAVGGEAKDPKRLRSPTSSLVSMGRIAGREGDVEDIIKFVVTADRGQYMSDSYKGAEGNLYIIPLVGGAGVGKTTLAQLLFNYSKVSFDVSSWVWAYDKGPMELMKAILESIGSSAKNLSVLDVVQRELINNLKGKCVLLILDDVWNDDPRFWETIWANLDEYVLYGSVAIITTQNYSVMGAMPRHIPQTQPFSVQPLSSGDRLPRLLEIDSCNSVWETSYQSLPAPLKRCFTYFALFPRDYVFKKDYLIKLWMAAGFIRPERLRKLEEIGGRYFNQLLYRSFLQHSWGATDEYTVPSDAHDLATSISEGYIFRMDDSREQNALENVRHLSYVVDACKDEIQWPPEAKLDRLRTYLAIRNKPGVTRVDVPVSDSRSQSMGYLRSLDLSHSNLVELPEAICYLKHLHFLALNYTPIKILPESMCGLYSLQTLQLKSCWNLQGLPTDIGKLIKLRHLELDAHLTSFCFPKGIGSLTDLQTLPVFNVGQNDGIHGGIEDLGKLGNLKGDLCIFGLCNVSAELPRPSSFLENMKSITNLTLCWSSQLVGSRHQQLSMSNDSTSAQAELVLGCLKPSTNLTDLTIQSYGGTRFPEWIGLESFNSMKYMKLENCMKCECLPRLGLLPYLRRLVLDCVSVACIDNEFCGQPNSFPAIKALCFSNMSNLREWCGVENGDFPELQELDFFNCPELTKIPQNIAPRETLTMEYCEKLSELPDLTRVKTMKLVNCKELATIPISTSLEELALLGCDKLKEILGITSLKTLKMENCKELTTFPSFPSLKNLELLRCDKLKEIPQITSLETLKMENCKELTTFPSFPSLKNLELLGCDKLKEIPQITSLDSLSLISCNALERLSALPKLQDIYIEDCQSCDLFQPPCLLPALKHLVVVDMPIQQIGPSYSSQFSSLETLSFRHMDALENWGVIEPGNLFPKLHTLELVNCPKLREFTSFAALPSLKTLQLCACDELESLPTFSSLTCLEVMYCQKFSLELAALESLSLLTSLWVEDCQKFSFPSLEKLLKVKTLFISNCDGLGEQVCRLPSTHKRFDEGNTLTTVKVN